MKKIKSIAAMLLMLFGLVSLSSCIKHDVDIDDSLRTPAVSGYTPLSSTVAGLEPGTVVTMTGYSLDKVVLVTVGENSAEISYDGYQSLSFPVPSGEYKYTIASDTYVGVRYQDTLRVYGSDISTLVYEKVFYVDVPADSPTAKLSSSRVTVGDRVTISGYNLDYVTAIYMGGIEIEIATQSANSLEFVVPDQSYASGDNVYILKLEYGSSGSSLTVSSEFTVVIPTVVAYSETGVIGGENYISGTGLDFIAEVSFAGVSCTIVSQDAENIIYTISSGVFDPVSVLNIVSAPVLGYYGDPVRALTLVANFDLDTSVEASADSDLPLVSSYVFGDPAGNLDYSAALGSYLGGQVTVAGSNLLDVSSLKLGGYSVEVVQNTALETLSFVVPDDFDDNMAKEYDLTASGEFGSDVVIGSVTIYPFYHWISQTIGAADASNRDKFAFLPESGRVVSTDTWVDEPVDWFAIKHDSGSDSYVGTSMLSYNNINKENITSDEYYSIEPYFFFGVTSDGRARFETPAGSNATLNNYTKSDGSLLIMGGPGTPVMYFAEVSDDLSQRVLGGALTTQESFSSAAGLSAPTLGTNWQVGDVLAVHHISYSAGTQGDMSGVHKTGFVVVRAVSDVSDGVGSQTSTVTFDMLWPKRDRLD